MLAWHATNAPVRQGTQPWDLERQVRLVAGSIVLLTLVGAAALVVIATVLGSRKRVEAPEHADRMVGGRSGPRR